MSILVFVEGSDGKLKKSSREAVSYAFQVGQLINDNEIIAAVFGSYPDEELKSLGGNGASKVLNVDAVTLDTSQTGIYAEVLVNLVESSAANMIIMSKSSFADGVGGRIAAKMQAAIVSNIVGLPDVSTGFLVRKSIFTGKAFATVSVESEKKVLIIKKNAVETIDSGEDAVVEKVAMPGGITNKEKITGSEKAEGDILLDDAEIVVSGGRGLKGPENWGMIEELAAALGAATGCSKPVSDLGWRPHHEHVGQTGVKVSPNLYIAVGISGAIQHLAGVNSSKVLVVINQDPEAPFFKAADYGIVGDAFEVIPKLTEKVKTL
jgi:electron transfer flavoprotein alpha subunit